MKENEKRLAAFNQAIAALPIRLSHDASGLSRQIQADCEELRLRAGQPLTWCALGKETSIAGSQPVTNEELQETLSRATRYSVHSFEESLKNGFVTLDGGHRLGLCGTAVLRDGMVHSFRGLSSINLRIAREAQGIADSVVPKLFHAQAHLCSTLIIAPPAWGKTTLLRDCIRKISQQGIRVAVADERCELGGADGGIPRFELGPTTDILSCAPKAEAVFLLLRTMSPMVLAVDEITAPRDVEAICHAAHCGVTVFATAHALDVKDFMHRPLYHPLIQSAIFERIVTISVCHPAREYHVVSVEEECPC